jgi:putative FmdB family regulatory protein
VPTYSYGCGGCPSTFSQRQGITEDPLIECPSCGEPMLFRKITRGGGVIFKGSGFYETDYKPKTPPKGEDNE